MNYFANLKSKIMKRCIIILLLFSHLLGCGNNDSTKTEIYQKKRNNIVDVSDGFVSIPLDIIIGRSVPMILGKYLLIEDNQSFEKSIHIFDKNNFEYIASTGVIGQGPGELTTASETLIPDTDNNRFFAMDLGKQKLYKFSIANIIDNNKYLPETQLRITSLTEYLLRFTVLNDSLFIVKTGNIMNNEIFRERMGRLNIHTGQVEKFGYENPEITANRDTHSTLVLSKKYGKYVNCYFYQDLITICKTDGTLLYNIYGPGWDKNKDGKLDFYRKSVIYKDKIIVSYLGKQGIVIDEYGRPKSLKASKLLVFNLQGDYLKTLDTKHEIRIFCVDEENNRLIFYLLDTDEPLAYINLEGIID